MWTTSSRWPASIHTSHVATTRADLYLPNGRVIRGLPMTGGSVTVDATASVRRTMSCDIADATGDLLPRSAYSPTAPYGTLIRPYRGIRYPDGTEELLPLGLFNVTNAKVRDDGARTLSITGSDRSRRAARDPFVDPYIIGAGTNKATAITQLIQNRLPGVKVTADATADTMPITVYDVQDDPWKEATEIAASYGAEVFFDQNGDVTLQASRDPSTDQVLIVHASGEDVEDEVSGTVAGGAARTLLEVEREVSDEPGYNGVVMTAESTTLSVPLRTVLWDMNPRSPTYALGPYGRVPAFQSNPYIRDQASCDAAAAAWLRKNLGGTDTVTYSIVPNPALDAGDVVRVVRSAAGVDVVGVIQSLTIPFGVEESMSVSLRSRLSLVTS